MRIEYDATGKRRYSTAEGEEGRVLTLQQRLSLAKILEDNRSMGRRRVDSWRLSRSLEEARTHPLLHRAAAPTCAAQPPLHLPRAVQVAWVFNHYCANIRSETVDAGLEAWGGPDCAQFIRNVGLPQYDIPSMTTIHKTTSSGNPFDYMHQGQLQRMREDPSFAQWKQELSDGHFFKNSTTEWEAEFATICNNYKESKSVLRWRRSKCVKGRVEAHHEGLAGQ